MPQVNTTPIAAASRAISNASGANAFSTAPSTNTNEVITMPAHGTPWLLIFNVNGGACFDMPRLRRIRPVEYRPELRLDIAAMISTTWMRSAIHPRPSRPNTVTNGLVPDLYSVVGSIDTNSRIDPQ